MFWCVDKDFVDVSVKLNGLTVSKSISCIWHFGMCKMQSFPSKKRNLCYVRCQAQSMFESFIIEGHLSCLWLVFASLFLTALHVRPQLSSKRSGGASRESERFSRGRLWMLSTVQRGRTRWHLQGFPLLQGARSEFYCQRGGQNIANQELTSKWMNIAWF